MNSTERKRTRNWLVVLVFVMLGTIFTAVTPEQVSSQRRATPTPTPTCTPATKGIGAFLKDIVPCARIGLQRTSATGGKGGGDDFMPPPSMCEGLLAAAETEIWSIWPKTSEIGPMLLADPRDVGVPSSGAIWVEFCGDPTETEAEYWIGGPNGGRKVSMSSHESDFGRWHYYSLRDFASPGAYTVEIRTPSGRITNTFTKTVYTEDFWEYMGPPEVTISSGRQRDGVALVKPGDSVTVNYNRFGNESSVLVGLYQEPSRGNPESGNLVGEWSFETSTGEYQHSLTIPDDVEPGKYMILARIIAYGDYVWFDPLVQGFVGRSLGSTYFPVREWDYYALFEVVNSAEGSQIANLTGFADASATSFLSDQWGSYPADNAMDGDFGTVWAEAVPGSGQGERLVLSFPQPILINELRLNVGYDDRSDLYSRLLFDKNNRIRRAHFDLGNGIEFEYMFGDSRGLQTVDIVDKVGWPVETDNISIEIIDVYKGNKWDDTCLAEVEVWGSRP